MATDKQSIFKDKLKKHMVMGGGIGTAAGIVTGATAGTAAGAVTGSVSGIGHTLGDELDKSGVKSHLKKNWKKYALGAGALVGGKYTYDQMDENGDMIAYYRDLKKKTGGHLKKHGAKYILGAGLVAGAATSLSNMKPTTKHNKRVSEQGMTVQEIIAGNEKLKAYREKLAKAKANEKE